MERFWDFCDHVLVEVSNLLGYLAQNAPWVLAVMVVFSFFQFCFLMVAFFWMIVRLWRGYPNMHKATKAEETVKKP